MVFSSLIFLFLFLPVVLLLYFLAPRRLKNTVLCLFSLVFYAWGEPLYIALMLFSIVTGYVNGRIIEARRGTPAARRVLVGSIVIHLLLLCIFKYSGFLVENLNGLFQLQLAQPNLPLPIGISFYTFQIMSYGIDVYRGEVKAQRNLISFGAYVALFPQLIAGPIVRYSTIARQMDCREHTVDQFSEGARRFTVGLGKKVLLANPIGALWTAVSQFAPGGMSVLLAWIGILAFTFQIYFDFSGYSDMAIGLGRMFGFTFLENFNYPYISKSITEFWRRWHISLSTWFRDYVYIPLGGNRKGMKRQWINLLVVWALTGIWHGASWNFLLWGVYYCVLLVLEKLFLLRWLQKVPAVLAHLYTMFFVMMGWVLFAFDHLGDGLHYFGHLFGLTGIPFINSAGLYMLGTNGLMLLVLCVASTPLLRNLYQKAAAKWRVGLLTFTECTGMVLMILLCVAYLVDSSYNPFLYFRF